VDWSGACGEGLHQLEASVIAHGRSIAIYQEIDSYEEQEKPHVHGAFLKQLQDIIPSHIKVSVITDAGFHRSWFQEVSALGWYFIGRVYSRYHYRKRGETHWQPLTDRLFVKKGKAHKLGPVELGKTKQPLQGLLYTYQGKLRNQPHKKNKYPSHETTYSNYYRKGWVIISSLDKPASELIHFYKKRMQIEQNFRDLKNETYGLGLRRNQSRSLTRIRMLNFLGILVSLLLWWIGFMAEQLKKQFSYQANTVKRKRVISLIHLGRLICLHEPDMLRWRQFKKLVVYFAKQYFSFIDKGELIGGDRVK
jgi:hypothetical protein